MANPLLKISSLPPFSQIQPEHITPAIHQLLAENRAAVEKLLHQPTFTWDNLLQPLADNETYLDQIWAIVSHLNAVMNHPELRQAYQTCLNSITAYATAMGQHEGLYQAVHSLATTGPAVTQLNSIQQKIIQDKLRDFHLAGVTLPVVTKQRLADLQQQLAMASNQFEENVLDATDAWTHHVTESSELKGIPEYALQSAAELARSKNLSGWLFTLHLPSYLAVMQHADNRALRQKLYQAFVTRASDQATTLQWDNSAVMQQILTLRYELAQLLGYKNYAELALEKKTAKDTAQVLTFLTQLIELTLPLAQQEFTELSRFAKQDPNLDTLQAWDMAYYTEKLQQHQYALTEELLRPYFPENQVLQGMFEIVQRLFEIKIVEQFGIERWHKEVRLFAIYASDGHLLGQFYTDLYARNGKRSGAWMEECRVRHRLANGTLQTPLAFLNCNFSSPLPDRPSLLTHEEVVTLFHEFGHTLHQLFSQVDYADVSGIHHVALDVVEFPSQFLENWCWEKAALALIAKHYRTGESLPAALADRLIASKYFQIAMQTLRQLEFALFDFRLHVEFTPQQAQQIQTILNEVRQQTALYPIPTYNRFQHSFSHIFTDAYAAGYYSYKWAEVWACDAFEQFQTAGIFSSVIGKKLLTHILSKGSSADPLQMFINFCGHPPQLTALLRQLRNHS